MLEELNRVREALRGEVQTVRLGLQETPAASDAVDGLEGRETALQVALRLLEAAAADLPRRVAEALEKLPAAPGALPYQKGYVSEVRRIVAALRRQG